MLVDVLVGVLVSVLVGVLVGVLVCVREKWPTDCRSVNEIL